MKYLLDVNVLVAWGWGDHADHDRVATWIGNQRKQKGVMLLTSAIPQLGFVRVSVQRSAGRVTPDEVGFVLADMVKALGRSHEFLPDDQTATAWPDWCKGAGRTTDAHLLQLARAHGAQLASLDRGIPGAFVVPD